MRPLIFLPASYPEIPPDSVVFTDWLSITARYLYSNSDSNTKVYDYDRHIIGGYFTIWLGERQERRTWNDWRTTL